jgi:hypothetical protein
MGTKTFSYDAAAILGLSPPSPKPLPEGQPGCYILYYGGWSMKDIRDSERLKHLIDQHPHAWYEVDNQPPPGIYSVRIPVPGTGGKTYHDQLALIPAGEEPVPAVIIATVLLSALLRDHIDPLEGGSTLCKEETSRCWHMVLQWSDGWISPTEHNDYRKAEDNCWISSYRLIS